ncbi:hypothetical protein [Virgibacillus ndiopensis]|uniref:hypothetical protein n=1 Tax=Virgibacillus ndiopensis TaxID=2004408 RepID=UPI000C07940E|nr:hypothetical protein [Virgibacillus ndiopensis]
MNDAEVFENPCAICSKRVATKLCDYIIRYDNGIIFFRNWQRFKEVNSPGYKHETCDLPLCDECSHNAGHQVDMCPHHYKLHQQAKLPNDLARKALKQKAKALQD